MERLEIVERVRQAVRDDRAAAADALAETEPARARRLVRAFSTYFHLANLAEQVHRGRALAARRREAGGGWLAEAVGRIEAEFSADHEVGELRDLVSRLHVRPAFTADPTEAARRTVLAKLRELARLLDELEAAGDDEAATARTMARLEELIDLLWQTDEIRVAGPEVLDEARNAVYYFDELAAGPTPRCSKSWPNSSAASASSRRWSRPLRARQLDRRRPRRQPHRRPRRHPGDPDADARARRPPCRRSGRRAARRPLDLHPDRPGDAGAAGLPGRRPRRPAGARPALPAPEWRGALPAEADLRAREARQHQAPVRRGPRPRPRPRLPRRAPAPRRAAADPGLARAPPRRPRRPRPGGAGDAGDRRDRAADGDPRRARGGLGPPRRARPALRPPR